jgi:hypothetical protein
MKFKVKYEGCAQLRHKDGEDVEMIIDSYRGTVDDSKDYQFIVMIDTGTLGLTRKQARKLAVAILQEEGK